MLAAIATKTTGLKYDQHEVIELSICPIEGNGPVSYYKIRPSKPENYHRNVQEINGISVITTASFPTKEEAMTMILNNHENIIAIGHNIKFDYEMLLSTFGKKFVSRLFNQTAFNDTMDMANNLNIELLSKGKPKLFKNLRLTTVCQALNVKFDTKSEAIRDCYRKLLTYGDKN